MVYCFHYQEEVCHCRKEQQLHPSQMLLQGRLQVKHRTGARAGSWDTAGQAGEAHRCPASLQLESTAFLIVTIKGSFKKDKKLTRAIYNFEVLVCKLDS